MFSSRLQGLNTLYGLTLAVLMPLWFGLATVLSVSIWRVMHYNQVNYPVYLAAIGIAFVAASTYRKPRSLSGPARIRWTGAAAHANSDMIFLTLTVLGIIYATKDQAISRQFVGAYLVASWGVLLLVHRHLPTFLANRIFDDQRQMKTLFVGSPKRADKLTEWAFEQKQLGMEVVGLVGFEPNQDSVEGFKMLGDISILEALIQNHKIQQVILLETRQSKAFVQFVVECCEREGVRILIFNPWDEFFHKPMQAINEGDYTFFALSDEPLQNPVNRLLKRVLDILVAIPVCLIVLPLLCLVVKMFQIVQSPGPLFYKQERTGAEKQTFTIYKFRTMRVRPTGDEARQASQQDDRIYPFGAFLRRTSLDEFPQFLNVVRGCMSVVGPRPHLIEHDEEFARLVEMYRTRHYVKPGITGMAQYKGYRGEIVRPEDLTRRLEYDLQYIYQWSIWLDIGIIIKTFAAIIRPPRTAY